MYDMPTASRGVGFASHASVQRGIVDFCRRTEFTARGCPAAIWWLLLTMDMGTPGNPVIDVTIIAGELVVTFADGTTTREELPEDDTMPDTLTTVGSFTVTDVAADIAATFTNGQVSACKPPKVRQRLGTLRICRRCADRPTGLFCAGRVWIPSIS